MRQAMGPGGAVRQRAHHCRSHGTPSPSPSISVPGQWRRNQVASSHDVICEQ